MARVKVSTISIHGKTSSRRFPTSIKVAVSKRRPTKVVPLGPVAPSTNDKLSDASFVAITAKPRPSGQVLSFHEAFGGLGPLMLLVVVGCIVWTFWLIVLSVAPNAAANFIMSTSELDNGDFWLIPDEWSTLQFFSTAGLTFVLAFYVFVLLKMLLWRSPTNMMQSRLDTLLVRWETAAKSRSRHLLPQSAFSVSWKGFIIWREFTGIHGRHRKFWNLLLKVHDLVMLSLMLRDQLEAGTPERISCGFAVLTALNALSCAAVIMFPRFTALVEILVDSLFDFTAAVIYPLVVLHHCSTNFHYDRAVYAINTELLPAGSFERRARMYANPAEIALVRASFDSLRILDVTDLFLRIGMNLAFSYRCKRIVEVLIQINMLQYQSQDRRKTSLKPALKQISLTRANSGKSEQSNVPKPIAALLLTFSVGVQVFTYVSISTSQSVCLAHPQCVVFAYRWRDTQFCPCIALVDGDPAPKTYYEWTHPIDATDIVQDLAAAGTLETLQLINRQLKALPEQLRGCPHLNFISLINCATEELPAWTKDFRNLQYLQVEGRQGSANLNGLQPDLFGDMPNLRYLQFGVHDRMLSLPSMVGAPNLRSIILSRLYNFVKLPPLTNHARLERLELSVIKQLVAVPDLKYVVPLLDFAVFQGAYLCCNGFRGDCNLTNPYCKSTSCLGHDAPKATQATLQVFKQFDKAVCQPYNVLSQVPTPATIQMCDGIPFRQCFIPNTTVVGMCYNHRMQVLACNPDPDKIRVRRRQIQERVGVPCDPAVEAWLGCPGSPLQQNL